MYSRVVKIVPVTPNGQDEEDVQFGIMDQDKNLVMSGFVNYDDAAEELRYQKEEVERIGDFGGDAEDIT